MRKTRHGEGMSSGLELPKAKHANISSIISVLHMHIILNILVFDDKQI